MTSWELALTIATIALAVELLLERCRHRRTLDTLGQWQRAHGALRRAVEGATRAHR